MKNSMYLQPESVFEITFGTQFWQIKKEVVCVIDIITRGMYDEYKLSRKSMWKHVHEFSKSTVGIFVLFFILENFEKVPKYRYSEFGSICGEKWVLCTCVSLPFVWDTAPNLFGSRIMYVPMGGEAWTEFVGGESMKDVATFVMSGIWTGLHGLTLGEGRDCVCWRYCMNVWLRFHGIVISVSCCW